MSSGKLCADAELDIDPGGFTAVYFFTYPDDVAVSFPRPPDDCASPAHARAFPRAQCRQRAARPLHPLA